MQAIVMLTSLMMNVPKEEVQFLLDYKMLSFLRHWADDHALYTESVATGFRVLYFSILDRILSELHRRFDESRRFVLAVAACSLKSKDFLKLTSMMPLVEECPDSYN